MDSFAAFVADQLDRVGEVELRPMFGGHGVYHRETIFGIVYDGRLYLKIDEESRSAFLGRGSRPFRPPSTGQTMRRYLEVPADVLEDADRLGEWASRAIRAAEGEPGVR